jgi:hypothetical protein
MQEDDFAYNTGSSGSYGAGGGGSDGYKRSPQPAGSFDKKVDDEIPF